MYVLWATFKLYLEETLHNICMFWGGCYRICFLPPQPSVIDEKLAAKLAASEEKLTLVEKEKVRIQKVREVLT